MGTSNWITGRKSLTITKQTGTCSLVQTHQTQVLDDPECRAARSTLNRLGDLTLDLETNLDNLQRVGEDLKDLQLAF